VLVTYSVVTRWSLIVKITLDYAVKKRSVKLRKLNHLLC